MVVVRILYLLILVMISNSSCLSYIFISNSFYENIWKRNIDQFSQQKSLIRPKMQHLELTFKLEFISTISIFKLAIVRSIVMSKYWVWKYSTNTALE